MALLMIMQNRIPWKIKLSLNPARVAADIYKRANKNNSHNIYHYTNTSIYYWLLFCMLFERRFLETKYFPLIKLNFSKKSAKLSNKI